VNLEAVRKAIHKGHVDWRKHSLSRLAERGIAQKQVMDVLLTGEPIESYEKDKPCPSGLFLGFPNGRPLHVVAALDETSDTVYIVTVYEPTLEHFESDYRTRRKT
jgi:hypothetical protein